MHIFYINLDSAADRRLHIEKQLQDIGLNAERLPAITPADLPEDFIAAYCDRPRTSITVSPGELACTMSHRRAWTEVVNRGLPLALILEDDAYLSRRLPELLNSVEPLCEGLDVLRVETRNDPTRVGPVTASFGGVALHNLYTAAWGTSGYIVTKRGAEKLIGPLTRYDIPVDHLIFNYHFENSRQLEIRVSIPAGVANGAAAIALQGDRFPSSLDGHRRERHERRMAERRPGRMPVSIRDLETALLDWKEGLRRRINKTFRHIEETTIPLY